MAETWFEIETQYNEHLKELEILFIGEAAGNQYKYTKSIPKAELEKMINS